MEASQNLNMFAYFDDFKEGVAVLPIIIGIQFIYVVIVWSTLVSDHFIASTFYFVLFWC